MLFKIKPLFNVTTIFFAILVVSLFYSSNLTMVRGHAIPDRYTLEPNSLLESSESFPSRISILFSERPDPNVSYIHITNSEGKRVDNNDFKITGEDGREATVTVNKNLVREGIYSLSWSTLSIDDGHVARGTYVVGVGQTLAANTHIENFTENNIVYSPVIAIIKTPIIIGQVYVLGFVLSQILIWKDIRGQGVSNIIDIISMRKFTIFIILFSIVIGVAATLIPIIQSLIISQTQSEYMKNLALLYFGTTNGQVWMIRIIICAIIAFVAYYYASIVKNKTNGSSSATNVTKRKILLYFLLISTIILIATNSITSHSASVGTLSQLGILADFAHSVAVSVWIGGMMYILYVVFSNVFTISNNISGKVHDIYSQPKSIILLILSRFSIISTICVGVIGITGLSLAWLHIQTMDELVISDYGRTLIIKLSLVLPVIILGGYHQFWISKVARVLNVKRENQDKPESNNPNFIETLSSLRRTVKIECILAASVLCAASLLTVTTPPATMQNNEVIKNISNSKMSSEMQHEFISTLETQGIPITFVISPFVTGFNNFTINFPKENEIIGQISDASLEFRKNDLSLGPIDARFIKHNDTAYSVNGGYLSQPGRWDVKITVKRINSYDLNYRVSLNVNKTVDGVHNQHLVDTIGIPNGNKGLSVFTPMVIGLSLMVAALSTYFCITAIKRLKMIQQNFALES